MNANKKLAQAAEDSETVDKGLYQSAVGSQINLFINSHRPDLSLGVSSVAKFC